MEFLVIGAGLPRTGTLSLMNALETVLPGNCHHMMKALHFPDEWTDIFTGKMNDKDFKAFFSSNNEVAAVDAPFCFHYERAMRVFPNAKVILTVRDPDGWVKSMKSTIFKTRFLDPTYLFKFLRLFPTYLGGPDRVLKKWPVEMFREMEKHAGLEKGIRSGAGKEYFNNWVREVERKVPAERLLKYHVKEGWEPLCKFLNLPQPGIPFPRVNSGSEFDDRESVVYRRSWLLVYEFISIPLWVYAVYRLTRQS